MTHSNSPPLAAADSYPLRASACGYLQGLHLEGLTNLAAEYNTTLQIVVANGQFVYVDQVIAYADAPSKKLHERLGRILDVAAAAPVQVHETGFKHLVEVAVKACSPALNDPATALTAVHYLTQLFLLYRPLCPFNTATNAAGGTVYFEHFSYEALHHHCFAELRH